MKSPDRLKRDEKGMMVFAMLGIVILLISIFAGAYFAGIRSESQKSIIDLAELKEVERKIEKVEREVENIAQEAGHLAVESVKENVENDYTLHGLKESVGERTTEIFEDQFEKRYSDEIQTGNLNLDFHLRPLKENQTDIEFIHLYLKEEGRGEESWSEIPGFFKVKRMVHVTIENPGIGSFSTRRIYIEREIKTDFFILADRMRDFDPSKVRKMIDCMVSGYVNVKLYDHAFDEDVGFKEPFTERFDTTWLKEYEPGDFRGGEKRENVWEENSTGFVERYLADEGRISKNSLLSEGEFIHISKLALLLEQIRAFRSYDETLLSSISDYFETEEKSILELIGEGRGNMVNLHGLVIRLFQEKDVLSDEIFLPDLFLNRITEDGFLSTIENDEGWTETSFWMINDLVRGEIESEETWRYQDLSRNIISASGLTSEKSYLRVLFSMYSNTFEEVLKSFNVNSNEVEEYVVEEIKSMEPLNWMKDVSIIGEEGTDQITQSILHRAKNLSMSFGFDEGSYHKTASPFFYMYFLTNWGFEEEKSVKITTQHIDNEGIHLGVQDKVRGELWSRAISLENSAKDRYKEITNGIERYNETEWYQGNQEQNEVWMSLNKTLEPLSRLEENHLFDERENPYITDSLEEHHGEFEERVEDVEDKILGLNQDAREYTEKILEMMNEYPGTKWRFEAYRFLYEEGEGNGIQENFLNQADKFLTAPAEELTASYNWSLEDYELSENINPGKRTDQSIGYRAIGSFTQEMVREFEYPSPLDYTPSKNLFKLINQNIFDLTRSREGEQRSRLMSILRGEGDPYSENLVEDDIEKISIDFTDKVVSSSDLEEIEGWWDEIAFERSISSLESIRTKLDITSFRLENENVQKEPYSDYADASFYRTTIEILDSLIRSMREYNEIISANSRALGYTYESENDFIRMPVVPAPTGDLTLHQNRSSEDPGFSHSLDLEVDIDFERNDVIRLHKISDTGTRVYRGDISRSQEWVNPFASRYSDHYSTALFVEYSTSAMKVQLSSNEEKRLVSEMYSSSEFTENFESRRHSSFAEVISPVPLLESKYSPRSVSTPYIGNVSVDRNIFNSTENKAEVTLELKEKELLNDQDIFVEVIKKRDLSIFEPSSKRPVTNLHHIMNGKDGASRKTLLSERISSENITSSEINLEFDLKEIEVPTGGMNLEHMIVRIRSEIGLTHMDRPRDLVQIPNSRDELYSAVPSFSTSEQMYILGEEKASHLEVFRIENRSESPHNGFDLVKNIPGDSWVIRKNGFYYLVNFEENLPYRDVLSGTFRDPSHVLNQFELLIDPRSELDRSCPELFPFIPENVYGYLIKNEFVPVYMSSSEQDNIFYPDRMMPFANDLDRVEWNSLHEKLTKLGYTLTLEKENNFYLHYDVGEFNGRKRVDDSFERTKRSIRELYRKERHVLTSLTTDISQSGTQMLQETSMIGEFAESDALKRESIFLAANFPDCIEEAGQLKTEHEDFTVGPIAKSIDLIGEDRTEVLLDWIEKERKSDHDKELRAFLSFDHNFIKDLVNRTGEEDYNGAMNSLDKKLEDMDFAEYRGFSIKDLSDIESLKYLLENFEEGYVSVITGVGITPSALDDLYSSYQIDLERFADSIAKFAASVNLPLVVQELNSKEYERVISLYMAGGLNESRVEFMPFGYDQPYLLIDDDVAFANIKPVDSETSIEEFIDKSLKKAVEELPPERGVILIEIKDEFKLEEIESYIGNRVEHHDPLYQKISWVELRVGSEIEYRYLHL